MNTACHAAARTLHRTKTFIRGIRNTLISNPSTDSGQKSEAPAKVSSRAEFSPIDIGQFSATLHHEVTIATATFTSRTQVANRRSETAGGKIIRGIKIGSLSSRYR